MPHERPQHVAVEQFEERGRKILEILEKNPYLYLSNEDLGISLGVSGMMVCRTKWYLESIEPFKNLCREKVLRVGDVCNLGRLSKELQNSLLATFLEERSVDESKALSSLRLNAKGRYRDNRDVKPNLKPGKWRGIAPASIEALEDQMMYAEPIRVPGIYFLCLGPDVVYVGRSRSPLQRSGEHLDKPFDRVFMLPVKAQDIIRTEQAFIRVLKPSLNDRYQGHASQEDIKIVNLLMQVHAQGHSNLHKEPLVL